jgi:5-methylcytosine-specific restriction endonuclease McrA
MPSKNRPDLQTADWKAIRLRILERDAHTCAYCGAEAHTVDHIIPASLGGTQDPSNLLAACLKCNGQKSNRVHHRTNWINTRWGVRLT